MSAGEPPVRRSGLGPGLCGFLAWFAAAAVVAPFAVAGGGHLAGLVVWAALGALILPLSAFGVVVNRRRIVKYPSGLAWVARRVPALRRLERRLRQVHELSAIDEVWADRDLVLRGRDGSVHRVYMNSPRDEVEALAATVRRFVEASAAAPPGEPQVPDVPVAVVGERDVVVRCAYCHDDLATPEPAGVCSACHAPHHEECLAVHGGCAVGGCARGRARTRG